ncbi:MAG TPA: TetR/AcrR family transcriptional regulator [Tepidisphaeraceae bacterium]|jgi:AcrR family transcriptional regulator
MQRPDDAKRQAIIDTAAALFARKAYHEVKLGDVAAAAKIGKGTVYIYFDSKEHLYDSLLLGGFTEIVGKLRALSGWAGEHPAQHVLAGMVDELVRWAYANPHFYELIRSSSSDRVRPKLRRRRKELGKCFADVIRKGVELKEFTDPLPDVTAQLIPAFVRSAVRWGPRQLPAEQLTQHILRVVGQGIGRRA